MLIVQSILLPNGQQSAQVDLPISNCCDARSISTPMASTELNMIHVRTLNTFNIMLWGCRRGALQGCAGPSELKLQTSTGISHGPRLQDCQFKIMRDPCMAAYLGGSLVGRVAAEGVG